MEQRDNNLLIYSIKGYGRVGSYAAAKRSGRSRAHRCWMITVFDSRPKNPANLSMGLIGAVPVERFGKFRTKKSAIERLLEFANESGGVVSGDLNGYPRVIIKSAIEPDIDYGVEFPHQAENS